MSGGNIFVGLLIVVMLLALFIPWWLKKDKAESISMVDLKNAAPDTEAKPSLPAAASSTAPDDLKRVEGIGPKISSVLQAAGILTFAQLATTDVARIKEILEAEDPRLVRIADPATWPEQAALAAAGKWDELAALQDELKGGRRVN